MALKKADLEAHRAEHDSRMVRARQAEAAGLYLDAVKFAVSAWEYVDGAMQYERRYEDREFESIEAVELALKYAPLLFRFEVFDELEALLKTYKRLDKLASDDLAKKRSDAGNRMWENRRLFSLLENDSDTRQDELRTRLGGDQNYWRWLVESWARMGIVERAPDGASYRIALATRMRQIVPGKCPSCGQTAFAPKADLLAETKCPKCSSVVSFVLMSPTKEVSEGAGT